MQKDIFLFSLLLLLCFFFNKQACRTKWRGEVTIFLEGGGMGMGGGEGAEGFSKLKIN